MPLERQPGVPQVGDGTKRAEKGDEVAADAIRKLRIKRQEDPARKARTKAASQTMVNALALRISKLDTDKINKAVKKLAKFSQEAKPRRATRPGSRFGRIGGTGARENPLAHWGPNAVAALFSRGSGISPLYGHRPWAGGKDGVNLPTSGKPFAFQGAGFTLRQPFKADASDIPENWWAENMVSWYKAYVNSDRPFLEDELKRGRYNHIRV